MQGTWGRSIREGNSVCNGMEAWKGLVGPKKAQKLAVFSDRLALGSLAPW